MKRRIKLTTTILAMTLVLALMTFSVFAAFGENFGAGVLTIEGKYADFYLIGSVSGSYVLSGDYEANEEDDIMFSSATSSAFDSTNNDAILASFTTDIALTREVYIEDILTISLTVNITDLYIGANDLVLSVTGVCDQFTAFAGALTTTDVALVDGDNPIEITIDFTSLIETYVDGDLLITLNFALAIIPKV